MLVIVLFVIFGQYCVSTMVGLWWNYDSIDLFQVKILKKVDRLKRKMWLMARLIGIHKPQVFLSRVFGELLGHTWSLYVMLKNAMSQKA